MDTVDNIKIFRKDKTLVTVIRHNERCQNRKSYVKYELQLTL